MGQRHQAFLIVRLTPVSADGEQTKAYYRCVCAIHHQWCYGRLPLSATRRFLNLLKNPENAEIVRDEIRRAHGKYGRQGTKPTIPALAFPYTQFLFVQAFNMDIDNPYYAYASGVGFEHALLNPNIGCFSHDNNDGITIVDITDPLNPAYYIIQGTKSQRFEKDIQCHITSMEHERLLTRDVLAEVWPNSFSIDDDDENMEEPGTAQADTEHPTTTSLPPLADLVLKQVIEQCITDDNFEPLELLIDMPGKIEPVATALFSPKALPDSATAVVTRVLNWKLEKNASVVDLSTFTSIRHCGAVNLSGLQTLTPEVIGDVLTAFPDLMRLTLLETNITNEQVMDLLYTQPRMFYRLRDLIHPALLVRSPPALRGFPTVLPGDPEELHALHQQVFSGPESFTVMFAGGTLASSGLGPAVASIPFFHPERVVQGLTKSLSVFDVRQRANMTFPNQYIQSHLGPSMALSISTPLESQPVIPSTFPEDSEDRLRWLHRSIGSVPIAGIYDKFLAHGWLFALEYNSRLTFNGKDESRYGFIRMDEEARNALLLNAVETAKQDHDADPKPNVLTAERQLTTLTLGAVKVYDIRGFADAVEKEGRPRPSEEVIVAFEQVIGGSRHPAPDRLLQQKPFRVMGLREAQVWFRVLLGELDLYDAIDELGM
ncbi:hypothetical protein VNI00_013576 [Paramarasmius palmivorus]|uniref:Uncharacterized protein n=1 Tax=Paramarasmius palmivorus TaxID=297713 RepID=A0AAW0BXU5_9AGAR